MTTFEPRRVAVCLHLSGDTGWVVDAEKGAFGADVTGTSDWSRPEFSPSSAVVMRYLTGEQIAESAFPPSWGR